MTTDEAIKLLLALKEEGYAGRDTYLEEDEAIDLAIEALTVNEQSNRVRPEKDGSNTRIQSAGTDPPGHAVASSEHGNEEPRP